MAFDPNQGTDIQSQPKGKMAVPHGCGFIWNVYDRIDSRGSNSYDLRRFYAAKEKGMSNLLLLGAGFALFCLFIAYERFCQRL